VNRKIMFMPAFDKINPDPSKNYGIGCLELRFILEGEKGVIEFQLLTNWYQEHVMKRRFEFLKKDVWSGKKDFLIRGFLEPFPVDICIWSLSKRHEDCLFFEEGVSYVFDGKPCYYDYIYRDNNDDVAHDVAYRKLVDDGEESLWKYLEEQYVEAFGNA